MWVSGGNLVGWGKRLASCYCNELVLRPGVLVVLEASPKRCYSALNLIKASATRPCSCFGVLTISCRTVGLLKSSVPVYVPSVTKYPPSTPSSFRLLSLSFFLCSHSFSSFLFSRSCLVSLLGSGWLGSLSGCPPMPRKDRSGLLPRFRRDEYTFPPCLLLLDRLEDGAPGEVGEVGSAGRSCAREPARPSALASFPELLPIVGVPGL